MVTTKHNQFYKLKMTETFQSSGHNIAWPKNYSKCNSAQKKNNSSSEMLI